jgi:hypothetical protein
MLDFASVCIVHLRIRELDMDSMPSGDLCCLLPPFCRSLGADRWAALLYRHLQAEDDRSLLVAGNRDAPAAIDHDAGFGIEGAVERKTGLS